jgi:exosortase/archaeosortase family protein
VSRPEAGGEPAQTGAALVARRRTRSVPRRLAGTLLCVLAVLAVVYETWYRGMEAALAGDAVGQWLGFPVVVARAQQTMFFAFHGTGNAHMLGFQVTLGCSSDLLVAPLLLFTGLLLILGQIPPSRVLLAMASAAAIVIIVNVLRLVMIAMMVDWWGVQTGFGWGHTLFGSVLTLAGMAAAMAACVFVLNRGRRARSPETKVSG